ncbi:MAG: UDP-galactopyranose mutase [Ignavibacteriae bacterium]|nr:UDP-galactopyranose mutase [Ignavibacteriota bacterium]
MVDYLIVGAGFSGCVLAERIATVLGKKSLIVEKRSHIGGNAYDYYNEYGILVHKYGPHIFHTNSQKVVDHLSQFTNWNAYQHKVLANVDGINIPVPFNLNSLSLIFPHEKAQHLEKLLLDNFGYGTKIPILQLRQSTDGELAELAEFIYQKVFLNYTKKQWNLEPDELDAAVTARVPVFISHDNRYFQDDFQGMPMEGYSAMFERMIGNNPLIDIALNTDYADILSSIQFNKLIFTGPIDEYFNYQFGALPYRSLRFEHETYNVEFYQETGTINYPNTFDYTRRTELKHLTSQKNERTTCTIEFPQPFIIGENEPYYPIPQTYNNDLYNQYAREAEKIEDSVIFCGRLADYKYYNMDQVVARALHIFEKRINI